jgi:hypothetical protein
MCSHMLMFRERKHSYCIAIPLCYRLGDNDDEGVGLRLDELLWDEWNEDHIARHGLEADEVEDAVFERPSCCGLAERRSGAMSCSGGRRPEGTCSLSSSS